MVGEPVVGLYTTYRKKSNRINYSFKNLFNVVNLSLINSYLLKMGSRVAIKLSLFKKKLKSHTKTPPIHNFLYYWTEIMSNIENFFKNSQILYFHHPKTGQKTKKNTFFSRFLKILRNKISKLSS